MPNLRVAYDIKSILDLIAIKATKARVTSHQISGRMSHFQACRPSNGYPFLLH
jgi:hypothetical protein